MAGRRAALNPEIQSFIFLFGEQRYFDENEMNDFFIGLDPFKREKALGFFALKSLRAV